MTAKDNAVALRLLVDDDRNNPGRLTMRRLYFAGLAAASLVLALTPAIGQGPRSAPNYRIDAIRYATIPDFPVAGLVMGAPEDERIDIAAVFWVIRDGARVILFDSGFHRAEWFERFTISDYLRPDSAVELLGVRPDQVTDLIISHTHWDHVGGIDLFPKATIWIQAEEFRYYTGPAWQEGGHHGGIDPEDIAQLVRRNTEGTVRLIDGDDVEILPGIRVYTGGRHTYASQYIRVDGNPPYVLASDNCYLYRNLRQHAPVATFTPADGALNLEALDRMVQLAGSADRVVPGHDVAQFERYPSDGRVARIR